MAELLLLAILFALLLWVGSLSRQIRDLSERLAGLEQDRRPKGQDPSPSSAPSSAPAPSRAPSRPAAPVPARKVPAAIPARAADQSLEVEIGSRWALIAGVVVLVLGVSFFVKYSFDRHWVNETTRVVTGTIAGLAL